VSNWRSQQHFILSLGRFGLGGGPYLLRPELVSDFQNHLRICCTGAAKFAAAGQFCWRRFLRLSPPFYAAIAVTAPAAVLFGFTSHSREFAAARNLALASSSSVVAAP
jgi:hypothetical protein